MAVSQFVFTVRAQEYYASRGFGNPPGRCSDCRGGAQG
ncbi:MAG TPA: zinc-ribbon domain containing protein [Chloroflexota bacterium]